MNNNTFEIDNITWNDLSLEDIYSRLNYCVSSAGDDYLYDRLKNPYICECEDFISQMDVFDEIKRVDASPVKTFLSKVSKLKNYKFKEVLKEFMDSNSESNVSHYIIISFVILSFVLIFIYPGLGVVLFFAFIAYSVSNYFKKKDMIASKLSVFNYLIRMLKASEKFVASFKCESNSEIDRKVKRISEITCIFKPFTKMTFLISEGAKTNSNPVSIVFDYIRMIFHVDIIKYNSMINFIKEHNNEAEELYDIIGMLDTALCLKLLEDNMGNEQVALNNDESPNRCLYFEKLCKPKFIANNLYKVEDLYHPAIKNPVCNSIEARGNILLTGCNASGKSTFLKSVAINAIFAQSLGMCFAKTYEAPFYMIYTSMALRDDIDSGESYFMTEIKSLKRIVDAVANIKNKEENFEKDINNKNCKPRVLCIIDEVLRGTNTIERIAASSEILKSLNNDNVMCFSATHDVELTELLSESFHNYHFSEEITNNDVRFNYKIKEGPTDSRNAIRLLSVLGYDDEIVSKATKKADLFIKDRVWI